ncbi:MULTISPECIES: transcriptional regulator [Pseudoalteromonas]|uniref:Transcriptional regulator n=1 Tax=Pseudoalteromonas agarivorans TaxID=176102 RepID=A0AAD0XEI9_9GAMM|nr:transcriptional regulator [Pseudoalteromonas agarivorans]AYM88288.1 transcriptional regulator [Pseudoalteromonas agarivorans]
MKHLLPLALLLITTLVTISLLGNAQCIEIGNASIASISFGTCDLSSAKTTLSPLVTIFWLAMNMLFAIIMPKPSIAKKYKVALFICSLPLSVFVYLIAYVSINLTNTTKPVQ